MDPLETSKVIANKYTGKLLELSSHIYLEAIEELYNTEDITVPEMNAAMASITTTLAVRSCQMFTDISEGMSIEVQWDLITSFISPEPNLLQLIRKKYEPEWEIPTRD